MPNTIISTGTEVVAANGVVSFTGTSDPPTVSSTGDGRIQLMLGSLAVFVTPNGWRSLNELVERHLADRAARAYSAVIA